VKWVPVARERNILVNVPCTKVMELLQKLCQHWLLQSHMQFAACQRGTIGQNVNLSGEAGYVAQCLQPSCECECVCVYLHTVLTAKRHSN